MDTINELTEHQRKLDAKFERDAEEARASQPWAPKEGEAREWAIVFRDGALKATLVSSAWLQKRDKVSPELASLRNLRKESGAKAWKRLIDDYGAEEAKRLVAEYAVASKARSSRPDDAATPEAKRQWQNSTGGRRAVKEREVYADAERAVIAEYPYRRLPPRKYNGLDYRINDYGCVINFGTGQRLKPRWKFDDRDVMMFQLQTPAGKRNFRTSWLIVEAEKYEKTLRAASFVDAPGQK